MSANPRYRCPFGARRPVTWDVMAEHLDEAGFLRWHWERALLSPGYTPGRRWRTAPKSACAPTSMGWSLAGPRWRSDCWCRPFVVTTRIRSSRAACALALHRDDRDQALVIEAVGTADGARLESLRACNHPPGHSADGQRARRGRAVPIPGRGRVVAMQVCARGRQDAGPLIEESLCAEEPGLVGAALGASRRLGRLGREVVASFLRDPRPLVRDAALRRGPRCGDDRRLGRCPRPGTSR